MFQSLFYTFQTIDKKNKEHLSPQKTFQ